MLKLRFLFDVTAHKAYDSDELIVSESIGAVTVILPLTDRIDWGDYNELLATVAPELCLLKILHSLKMMKMKTINFLPRLPTALVAILGIAIMGGCTKPLTKSDVQDDLQAAREATENAEGKNQQAYAARKQYYTDFRETKVKDLEDRSSKIDDRMRELKKVAKKSTNQAAQGDIASAIAVLQDEKETLNERIVEVKSIKEEYWSSSYEEISAAIGKIEGEMDKLSQGLETDN